MTHTDDLHEGDLRDLLVRTMSDSPSPSELGPYALLEGKRLRARRRSRLAAGAVAASAAAALILPMALGGGSTTVADPAGRPAGAASAPEQDPVRERPDGWWNMPATDMVAAMEAILPDGVTVTAPGPLTADTEEGGPALGYVVPFVTGPGGAGRVNVMLYPDAGPTTTLTPDAAGVDGGDETVAAGEDGGCDAPELADSNLPCTELGSGEEVGLSAPTADGIASDISCAAEHTGTTQCRQIRDEDGIVIGRRLTNTSGQVTTREVVLRRNGGTVYAAASNTLDDTWGVDSPASAEAPPLTLDQLEDLARNDTWVSPAT